MVKVKGIEPSPSAPKAATQPLRYTKIEARPSYPKGMRRLGMVARPGIAPESQAYEARELLLLHPSYECAFLTRRVRATVTH